MVKVVPVVLISSVIQIRSYQIQQRAPGGPFEVNAQRIGL